MESRAAWIYFFFLKHEVKTCLCCEGGEEDKKKKEEDGGKGMRRQDAAKLPEQAEGLGTSDKARRGEPARDEGERDITACSVRGRHQQSCAETCLLSEGRP